MAVSGCVALAERAERLASMLINSGLAGARAVPGIGPVLPQQGVAGLSLTPHGELDGVGLSLDAAGSQPTHCVRCEDNTRPLGARSFDRGAWARVHEVFCVRTYDMYKEVSVAFIRHDSSFTDRVSGERTAHQISYEEQVLDSVSQLAYSARTEVVTAPQELSPDTLLPAEKENRSFHSTLGHEKTNKCLH